MRTSVWAIGLLVVLSGTAAAQSARAKVDMNAPAPRLPNGKPDFSGAGRGPASQDMTRTVKNANGTSNVGEPNPLPFTPWGQAQWDNYNATKNGDYAGSCMPFGWIRSFTPHPMQILQNNEIHRVPVRAEHHVPGGQHRGTAPSQGLAADLVRRLPRPLGRRHAGHRSGELQRLDASSARSAIR